MLNRTRFNRSTRRELAFRTMRGVNPRGPEVSRAKLEGFLREQGQGGKVFSVSFCKLNGQPRDMVCRLGVKKGVKNPGQRSTAEQDCLPYITVFDMQCGGFRNINLSTIYGIRAGGQDFSVC